MPQALAASRTVSRLPPGPAGLLEAVGQGGGGPPEAHAPGLGGGDALGLFLTALGPAVVLGGGAEQLGHEAAEQGLAVGGLQPGQVGGDRAGQFP